MANKIKVKLNEQEYKLYRQLLKEDQEGDSINKAIKYAEEKMGMEHDKAVEYVRKTFRDKIHACRTKKGGKFILGALRLYNEEIKTDKNLRDLERCIKILSSNDELYKKYSKDLNGLHLNTLIDELKDYKLEDELDNNEDDDDGDSKIGTDYNIESIDTFDISNKYSPYVSWCVTKSKGSWENYTNSNIAQFYFVTKPGFENMEASEHRKEPLLGEYGLSMLAICVNPDGSLKTCTCRWNHDKGGNDNCMGVKDIENLLKCNFRKVFKPNKLGLEIRKSFDKIEEELHQVETVGDLNRIYENVKKNLNDDFHKMRQYGASFDRCRRFLTFRIMNTTVYIFHSDDSYDEGSKCTLLKKIRTDKTHINDFLISFNNYYLINDVENNRCYAYDKKTLEESNDFGILHDCKSFYDRNRDEGFVYLSSQTFKGLYHYGEGYSSKEENLLGELTNFSRMSNFETYWDDWDSIGEYVELVYYDKNEKERHAIFNVYGSLFADNAEIDDIFIGSFFRYYKIGEDGERSKLIYHIDGEDVEGVTYKRGYGNSDCCTILTLQNDKMGRNYCILEMSDYQYQIYGYFDDYEIEDMGSHYVLVTPNEDGTKTLNKVDCEEGGESGFKKICKDCESYETEPLDGYLLAFTDNSGKNYLMDKDYDVEEYDYVLDRAKDEWESEYENFIDKLKETWEEKHEELKDTPEDEIDDDDNKYVEDFDEDNFEDEIEEFKSESSEYEIYQNLEDLF